MKVAIGGTGYIGLSYAVLLAQQNEVVAIDVVAYKIKMLNNKQSPFQGIMKRIKAQEIEVVVYEPSLKDKSFFNSKVIKSLQSFKNISNVLITNRIGDEITYVASKV